MIENVIKEMHSDFCNGRTLAFAEKLESLLEFADMVAQEREQAETKPVLSLSGHKHCLGEKVWAWPATL